VKSSSRTAPQNELTPRLRAARVLLGALLVCFGSVFLPGCSDTADDEEEETEVDPVAACNTYATTWCNRSLNCYAQVGRITQAEADESISGCTDVIVGSLPCSAATSVESDYDRCLSQVRGMPCSRWNVPRLSFGSVAPPTSCDTALGYE
jgi:hypothetical protein